MLPKNVLGLVSVSTHEAMRPRYEKRPFRKVGPPALCHVAAPRVPLFLFLSHFDVISVIYSWTDARKYRIFLLMIQNRAMTFIAQGTKYFNSLGAGRLNSKNYAKKIRIIRSSLLGKLEITGSININILNRYVR